MITRIMLPLSPTEEYMIWTYRKACQYMNNGLFWFWTTSMIYANMLREWICGTEHIVLPSIPRSPDTTYIVGEFAKEHIVATTLVFSDGSEVDFNETYLYENYAAPISIGALLRKYEITYSTDVRLSVIMSDGTTHIYDYDEPLVLRSDDTKEN